jgi:hypothetical protein
VLADPDTIAPATRDDYITYGTTVRGFNSCGQPHDGTGWYVPYIVSGSGATIDLDLQCIAGDAMPAGPGAWAEPGTSIWAPSVVYFGGRYILYYTASKRGTNQKCIGKAGSSSPLGPFSDGGVVACPLGGRWALDADAFVDNGSLYMIYRDDGITTGQETGISVVRMDGSSGAADWPTRQDVLLSTDITWESAGATNHVIENPTMMNVGGHYNVFFSGNNWETARYSTGIAVCSGPLPGTRCSPYGSTSRPYFGYSGSGNIWPLATLPGNLPGPGGMSLFRNRAGDARVVWHHLISGTTVRRGMAGALAYDGFVWSVS